MYIKKKISRILAFALSLCMIVGLMPGGMQMQTASAADEYTFDFRGPKYDGSGDLFKNYTGTNWKYAAASDESRVIGVSNEFKWDYTQIGPVESVNDWMAIRLNGLESGKYDATVNALVGHGYIISEFYFMPLCDASQIAGKLTEDTSLGEVDFHKYNAYSSNGQSVITPFAVKSVNVPSDGDYLFVIRGTGKSSITTTIKHIYIQNLKLDRTGDADPVEPGDEDEKVELYYDFKFDINVLKEMGGGTQDTAFQLIQATDYSKTGRNWRFYNYPTSAWAGASTKWDGRLSFAGMGLQLRTEKENLWAAVELDVTQAADYNIVLDYAKYSSGSVSEIYMFPAPAENSVAAVEACLTAANLKGSVNFADANNAGVGFNTELGSINVDKAGKYVLVIRGTSADDGNFAFVSGLKLVPKTEEEPPVVPEVEYTYSLRTYTWDGSGNGFNGFDGGNWQLYSRNGAVALYDYATWTIPQFKGFTNNGDYVAFELKNLVRGKYDVSMDAQKSSASVKADFYIIPKCDVSKILENCTEEYLIGEHDNYKNPSESAPSTFEFANAAQVAKDGNYLLVAKKTGGNSGADRLQFANVKLVRVGDSDLPEPEDPLPPPEPELPEGEPYNVKFDFTGVPWDQNGDNIKAHDGGNWKWFVAAENPVLIGHPTTGLEMRDYGKKAGGFAALELFDLKAGVFNLKFDSSKMKSGTIFEYYLIPKNAASDLLGACNEDTYIGEIDYYNETEKYGEIYDTFKCFTVPADGNYLLVIKTTGRFNPGYPDGNYSSYAGWMRTLEFDGVLVDVPEDTTPAKIVTITAPETLEIGTAGDVTFTIELTDGKKVYTLGKNDTIEYIIEPNDVVSVDASGRMTANKVGTATVQAKLNFRNAEVLSNTVTVEVTPTKKVKFDFMHRLYELQNLTEITFAETDNSWQFYDYSRSVWPDANTAWDKTMSKWGKGLQFKLDSADKWAAVELNFPVGGRFNAFGIYATYQSGGINELYLIPVPEEKDEAAVVAALTEENLLGVIDYTGGNPQNAVVADLVEPFGEVVIPEAGSYLLVAKGTKKHHPNSTGYYTYHSGMEFKLVEAEFDFEAEKSVIEYGTSANTSYTFKDLSGKTISEGYSVSYKSSDSKVATVDANGVITAKGVGEATITAVAEYKDNSYLKKITVSVEDNSAPVSATISIPEQMFVRDTGLISFEIQMESGNVFTKIGEIDDVYYVVSPEGAIKVGEDNVMVSILPGQARIKAIFTVNGETVESNEASVDIISATKQGLSIYTEEERENILYNAQHDSETRKLAQSYANAADKFVENLDFIYEQMIVAEGLPRYYFVGKSDDPNRFRCKLCGCDISKEYTTYGWLMDSFNTPWKIKCPDCRGTFPTNDFGSYYKLGLDERGVFDPELARKKNDELIASGHEGYLVNKLYPDKGADWGVDDGFGYIYTYQNEKGATVTEQHSYIAYYLHFMWYGAYGNKNSVQSIIDTLTNAYLYTGDVKYARAGAILLDRIADFYPDFDWYQWRDFRNDSSGYNGNILDAVWSCDLARTFTVAYDAFYPVYSDPYVINYLNEKSKKYEMFPKNSAAMICKNIEVGILEAVYDHARWGNIAGNFGMAQNAVISAAVAYNNEDKSREMLDWVMRAGTAKNTGGKQNIQGGNVMPQLAAVVDRDGMGNEASPSYNNGWIGYLVEGAEYLKGFELCPEHDLYQNPKFIKMFDAHLKIIMAGYYSPAIGDSDAFAGTGKSISPYNAKFAYMATGDTKWAQLMYLLNGNKADGLRYPDTVKDPSRLEDEVLNTVKKNGEMSLGSSFQSGYGLYALRDGRKYANSNTSRDFWMYTGANNGHGHRDALNLGIDAYGLNMAPDLGYPKDTGTEANRHQWVSATISHNTVTVDNRTQVTSGNRGTPMHFDDAGKVKVMDADRKESYSQTDAYRRTVVMVEVDDQVSYGVDFFRIVGGNDHLYSFHSQSNKVSETEGLELVPADDPTNTYAGFKYDTYFAKGEDPHPNSGKVWTGDDLTYPAGYTWMDNVTSDAEPDKQFAVDFEVKDFRKVLKDSTGLHLRMTMLNDFALNEVTVLSGYPVDNYKNPDTDIKYVLARRTGENLDTLFTTVFEPYKSTRYIDSMTSVPVSYANGNAVEADAPVKAVKVVHKNNRIDYVVYAADNSVEYTVDGLFNFKGFVGVVTYEDANKDGVADDAANPAYTYLNDGSVIANNIGALDAYTGAIESVKEGLSLDNRIVVNINGEISDEAIADLSEKVIYVNNDGKENGAYQIVSATRVKDSTIEINIGDVSPVRAYIDTSNLSKGFTYNILAGQTFRIPLSHVTDSAPVLTSEGGTYNATAEKKFSFKVQASSDFGKDISYEAVILPRGASFDTQTATFTWTPDNTQIGEHSAAIKVSDGTLSATYNAIITVYRAVGSGSTGEGGNNSDDGNQGTQGDVGTGSTPPAGDNAGSGAGSGSDGGASGGGASGGGGASSGGDSGNTETGGDNTGDVGDGVLDVPSEKFVDLGNHAWAEEAIYALVEKGVVNGTSAETYSPANNIKRADFAIMLVRAFDIAAGEGENFADVDASKYYAEELRLAKANGIVGGIGDNKFNPEGEITRQDMMVMLARALKAAGKELDAADESVLAQFADAAAISDYAREAVAQLVGAGAIAGANGKINPLGRATRAEVAMMLNRIFA